MDLTWRYVAIHELTHILHGHVEYLSSLAPHIPFLGEALRAHGSVVVAKNDMDKQTMELWADHVAITAVLGGLLTKSPGLVNGVPLDSRQRLFLWGFTLYALFRLWGIDVVASDMSGSHPPTAIRFMMAVVYPCRFVVGEAAKDISDDEFLGIVYESQREAEKAIRYCGATGLPIADVIDIRDQAVRSHIESLRKHFADVLTPSLMKHSYIPLTAI